jgi:hypothetical protein
LTASDNWRELAKDFRSLAAERDYESLWAVRTLLDNGGIMWELDGTHSFESRFSALAARSARELNPSAIDLVETWLEALRIENPHALDWESPLEWPEGKIKRTSERYSFLCEASSDFCSALEARAIEQEQRARLKQDDKTKTEGRISFELQKTEVPIEDVAADREARLQSFVAKKTSIAMVCRTAKVYKANMQQWRHGELADDSVMSQRIEDVLSGKTPLVSRGKKKG